MCISLHWCDVHFFSDVIRFKRPHLSPEVCNLNLNRNQICTCKFMCIWLIYDITNGTRSLNKQNYYSQNNREKPTQRRTQYTLIDSNGTVLSIPHSLPINAYAAAWSITSSTLSIDQIEITSSNSHSNRILVTRKVGGAFNFLEKALTVATCWWWWWWWLFR